MGVQGVPLVSVELQIEKCHFLSWFYRNCHWFWFTVVVTAAAQKFCTKVSKEIKNVQMFVWQHFICSLKELILLVVLL